MNKKKMLISLLATLVLVPAAAGATVTTYFSPHMCQTTSGGFSYIDRGLQNWDFEDHGVYCPASWTSSAANGQANAAVSIDAATLIYSDTSSGSFGCHVIAENWDGSIHSSETLFSCSTYGGCGNNYDTAYQGTGQLNWVEPIGGTLYPTSIDIYCTVPGSDSILRGYNVSVN
jgi:hypothetical protein